MESTDGMVVTEATWDEWLEALGIVVREIVVEPIGE